MTALGGIISDAILDRGVLSRSVPTSGFRQDPGSCLEYVRESGHVLALGVTVKQPADQIPKTKTIAYLVPAELMHDLLAAREASAAK